MTGFPENPFRPEAGCDPAHRGARPEAKDTLDDLLDMLRNDSAGPHAVFLFGPRGTGKTVLMRWLEEAVRNRSGGKRSKDGRIFHARLPSEEMASPVAVVQAILDATAGSRLLGRKTAKPMEGVPGLAGVRITGGGGAWSLSEELSRKKEPLLITLDEAQEAPPETLGGLMTVVQMAGSRRPIATVFAGTPRLNTVMHASRVSFWDRGRKLRIGLLTDESAQDALARPFRDAGLEADDGAVAELAAAADNYPYFLQLYGRAAWQVVEASGGRSFLPEHVAPTIEAAKKERLALFDERYREFADIGLLPVARKIAEALVASAEAPADRSLHDMKLNKLMEELLDNDAELREILAEEDREGFTGAVRMNHFLLETDYAWWAAAGDPSWMPAIPSLMDYMLDRIPPP